MNIMPGEYGNPDNPETEVSADLDAGYFLKKLKSLYTPKMWRGKRITGAGTGLGFEENAEAGTSEMKVFEYNKTYSEEDIRKLATPVNHQVEYLVADTPDMEYWFVREGHYWKLSHTWKPRE